MIRRTSGSQFDPFIAEIMLEDLGPIEEARDRFGE